MATLTLYDGETGEPVRPDEPDPPGPVVAADNHEAITFALDPAAGRALVQFVVEPGTRRLVAGVQLGEDEDLRDIHRVVRERLGRFDLHVASPDGVPPHLNLLHYLADPDPPRPGAEVRRRLREADEPIEVGVPTAADAVSVAAFVHAQVPWKVVAVHPAHASVGSVDADVTVPVDSELDGVTHRSRRERGSDDAAAPDEPPAGPGATPAAGAADTRRRPPGGAAVLRIYDGSSGDLEYDSRRPRDPPSTESDAAARAHRDGLALFLDPEAGVLQAILGARGDGTSRRFVAVYERPGGGDDLLASFRRELEDRVADLGVEFFVDVGGDPVGYDRLADADPTRPTGLSEEELSYLGRADGALDFAAPGGTAAFELAAFLAAYLEADRSIAICEAGRTDYLASTDVVVTLDPACEGIEPRGETATRLAERQLQDRLTDARDAVEVVVGRVEEITGTPEARRRVLAAALSGEALSGRGLALVPTDDRRVERRRRQARYLTLYGLLAAGLAYGALIGHFDPLELDLERYAIDLGPLARTSLPAVRQPLVVDASLVLVGCLATIALGGYWLLGPRLGLGVVVAALAGAGPGRIAAGLRREPVPARVREPAEALRASIRDLQAAYERLAGREGAAVGGAEDFAAFLEKQLFARPAVPGVAVVRRGKRWARLLGAVATGVLVGAAAAGALLGSLWIAVAHLAGHPEVALDALLGVAVVVLLASIAKGLLVLRRAMGRTIRHRVSSMRRS